jgi:extradiol dioxygenase family protein
VQARRRYDDRITLDFCGDQVVCHLTAMAPPDPAEQDLYPRHFGVTFHEREDLDRLLHLCEVRKIPFWRGPSTRFEGLVEEHHGRPARSQRQPSGVQALL